jgi:type VI secretion system protein ImpA
MSPAAQFDLEALLAPISADHPSGESLRYEAVYDEIKEHRRSDDPSLPQGVWQRPLKKAEWQGVEEVAVEALETRSKDLQIAGWLAEAWAYRQGFPGVERGLRLVAGLCEGFWEDLHPRPEDGDLEFRLAPLLWLDEQLTEAVRQIPITRPGTEAAAAFSWSDWETGLYLANLALTDRQAAEEAEVQGRVTQPKFLASATLTPGGFYAQLAAEVAGALAATAELARVLADRCGREAPSMSRLNDTLKAIESFAARTVEERVRQGDLPAAEDAVEAAAAGVHEEGPPTAAAGPIRSRAEAYRRLDEAAVFLMRTEPHSPAPYLVKRAVAWGHMSLTELLAELLADKADLATVYKLLGIARKEPA